MDRTDELFDFDAFENNGQDVSLVADNHLFDNGPDLFGLQPFGVLSEPTSLPPPSDRIIPFANGNFQENGAPPNPRRRFFDATPDLFAEAGVGTEQSGFPPPMDLPAPQFMAQQYNDSLGLTFGPTYPMVPEMPSLTIDPATLFDETLSCPQIVPATPGEQQRWQTFKDQQTQFFQPEPQLAQTQQTQIVQQWPNAGDQLGFHLQSPFESHVHNQAPQEIQAFEDPQSPLNLQQVEISPQGQEFLSDEQIQLLQNAEAAESAAAAENAQHSDEVSPTTTSSSPAEAHSQKTSPSRNTSTRRHSRSSRTTTPELGTQQEPPPQAPLAGLTFVSLQDAEAAMPSRYIESDWKPPSPDNTIPTTQEKRAEYVRELFDAIQDTSECKDNRNGFSYIKRWRNRDYYDLQSMEKVCWHMLDIAERLHVQGPSSTNMYCDEALKKLKASRSLSFEQRIHAISSMLRFSKYLCDQLMKGEGLEALVGAPKQKMSGATTMHVQNKKRQKWIVHGRTEDPLHPNAEEIEEDEQNDSEVTRPAQRKTKKKAKRTTPAVKPRAKAKARSRTVSRDESDDDESRHRRQSKHDISTTDESDLEMTEPSPPPAPRTPSRRPHRTSAPEPSSSPVALPWAVPVSSNSPHALSPAASTSSDLPASPEPTTKPTPPRRAPFPQVQIPRTEVNAGRARFGKQQKLEKLRKERLAATRAASKAQVAAAEAAEAERQTKQAAAKMKNKTKGKSRMRDWSSESDSEDEEPAPPAKRPRKTLADPLERVARRPSPDDEDESSDSDQQDAGKEYESDQHSDGDESDDDQDTDDDEEDEDDDKEEDEPEHPEVISATPFCSNYRKSNKRKLHVEESDDEPAAPTKRIMSNDGSPRKSATPAPATKQASVKEGKKTGPVRDAQGRFIRRETTLEPEPAAPVSGRAARVTPRTAADVVKRRDAENAEVSRRKRRGVGRK